MTQGSLQEMPPVLDRAFHDGDAASEAKAQERENVELLGRLVYAISQGRFDELREQLAPDVTYEAAAPAHVPWVRRAAGVAEVAAAIEANFAHVCEQRPQPLSLVSQGDTLMVMARETGCWKESGAPYEVMLAQQYTFRDGRLAAFRSITADAGEPAPGS
jgi:ketosteroid isomerase-like protein